MVCTSSSSETLAQRGSSFDRSAHFCRTKLREVREPGRGEAATARLFVNGEDVPGELPYNGVRAEPARPELPAIIRALGLRVAA
jgi:hypothetical protein